MKGIVLTKIICFTAFLERTPANVFGM